MDRWSKFKGGQIILQQIDYSTAKTVPGAHAWLLEVAAPLWATRGRTASGLFSERMTLGGDPDESYFRVFVQARHIYAFATIGHLGWAGPWRALIAETITAIVDKARRSDGFFVHRLDAKCRTIDERADLYDQAFVLFALATAGDTLRDAHWFDVAEDLLSIIESRWVHPEGGYFEGEMVDNSLRRQNPHMHLLEATMALAETSGRPRFAEFANSIADLAVERFIDSDSGALLEYFTDELNPALGIAGQIVEPGHCFEWAWLFERLGVTGRPDLLAVSDRLIAFARTYGVCMDRGVCINEVLTNGRVHDATARLWPQTERIKAAAVRHRRTGNDAEAAEVAAALCGLSKYYKVPTPGLWHDKLKEDGTFIEELVRGSSLYHITCAYGELREFPD